LRPKVNDPLTWLDISGYGVSSHHSKIGGDGTGMDKTVADLRASPRVNRRVYHRGEKHPDWCFSFTQYCHSHEWSDEESFNPRPGRPFGSIGV